MIIIIIIIAITIIIIFIIIIVIVPFYFHLFIPFLRGEGKKELLIDFFYFYQCFCTRGSQET